MSSIVTPERIFSSRGNSRRGYQLDFITSEVVKSCTLYTRIGAMLLMFYSVKFISMICLMRSCLRRGEGRGGRGEDRRACLVIRPFHSLVPAASREPAGEQLCVGAAADITTLLYMRNVKQKY